MRGDAWARSVLRRMDDLQGELEEPGATWPWVLGAAVYGVGIGLYLGGIDAGRWAAVAASTAYLAVWVREFVVR